MIKAILIVVAVALALTGTYFAFDMLLHVAEFLLNNTAVLFAVISAVVVQLVGHMLRAKRTKLVLDQATGSSFQFQFGALSVGYLFNALIPFRFGEIIRALLVAKRLHISFLYTFVAIVIERATDVIFLSILIVIGVFVTAGPGGGELLLITLTVGAIAALLIYTLVLLKNENKYMLSMVSRVTNMFNVSISNKLRFKVWSLIFGLQSFFGNGALVRRYILYAVSSWLCYFMSVLIIVISLLKADDLLQVIATSISPYIISFSPVDASSYQQLAAFLPAYMNDHNLDIYTKIIWIVLTLPMASIGLITLFLYRPGTRKTANSVRIDPYSNKLLRYDDISQEFPAFLETYFKGYGLTHILHKIELNGELSLVKFFKGGSDAITVLAIKGDKMFVKKIVPAKYTDRLRVQYLWLKKHASKRSIVDVLAEHKSADYYAIDLSYDPEHISLFEYIHTHSLEQAKQAIDSVWRYVFRNIYNLQPESVNTEERDVYIQERLMNKIKVAVEANEDLERVIKEKTININGEDYDNFYTVIDKIKNHKQAWNDLAIYRKSAAIHGDLTIDNILVDPRTNKPFIIDPSDDNQVRGPIIDFARQTQSLVAGYEFMNNDDEAVGATKISRVITINFHDRRSAKYMQLYDYLSNTVAPEYLTETERKTVLFHAGLMYGRMLAHRVVINPHNTLKYYAVSVVLLNKFYRQYQ